MLFVIIGLQDQKKANFAIFSPFLRFGIFKLSFGGLFLPGLQNLTAMLPDEKNITQTVQPVQQVVAISNIIDFNSAAIKEEMEKVQQEVKSVIEGAIVDSSKLSLNFTV